MKIHTAEVTRALRILGQANKRDGARNVNLAGKLLTSFAYRGTREAGEDKVRRQLMAPARKPLAGPPSKSKGAREFQGTVAAAIVGARLRRNGQKLTPGRMYGKVRKMVKARVRSSGYHRAGHIPALRAFRVGRISRRRGRGRFASPIAGRARAASKAQRLRPHAFLENSARGIAQTQPNVYRRHIPSVSRQLIRFARQDMLKAGRLARLV